MIFRGYKFGLDVFACGKRIRCRWILSVGCLTPVHLLPVDFATRLHIPLLVAVFERCRLSLVATPTADRILAASALPPPARPSDWEGLCKRLKRCRGCKLAKAPLEMPAGTS